MCSFRLCPPPIKKSFLRHHIYFIRTAYTPHIYCALHLVSMFNCIGQKDDSVWNKQTHEELLLTDIVMVFDVVPCWSNLFITTSRLHAHVLARMMTVSSWLYMETIPLPLLPSYSIWCGDLFSSTDAPGSLPWCSGEGAVCMWPAPPGTACPSPPTGHLRVPHCRG